MVPPLEPLAPTDDKTTGNASYLHQAPFYDPVTCWSVS